VSPVFVMGLPRTGTTLLHRLLSLDTKRFRAPLLWELLNPVPSRNKDGTYLLTYSLTHSFTYSSIMYSGNYISIHADKETLAADQEKRFQFIKKLIDQRKKLGDKVSSSRLLTHSLTHSLTHLLTRLLGIGTYPRGRCRFARGVHYGVNGRDSSGFGDALLGLHANRQVFIRYLLLYSTPYSLTHSLTRSLF